MSSPGLTKGSPRPPPVAGKWRVYGRPMSVQTEKLQILLGVLDIPHEVVHISYDAPPEWYTEVQPEGKFPVLDTGSEVIAELGPIARFVISKHSDSKFINRSHKDADKALGEKVTKVDEAFVKALMSSKAEDVEAYYKEVEQLMKAFVAELKKRGTPYLLGDSPGLSDFFIWPTVERVRILSRLHNRQPTSTPTDEDTNLVRKWRDGVLQVKTVQEAKLDVDKFVDILKARK